MKSLLFKYTALAVVSLGIANGQAGGTYTNFIRQVQLPSGVQWDAAVTPAGQKISALPIDLGGSRFELWTVLSSPLTSYRLDSRYVSAYMPTANVVVRSEDPYATIPRTRADRPFYVDITSNGILSGVSDPLAAKSLKLLRHTQSYGAGGTGQGLDRSQASLLSQAMITQNGSQTLTYPLSLVPGADRTKLRGEERFSVFSLADGLTPENQVASRFIQIWPVADGTISGITQGQKIRFRAPDLTIALNDLYPDSRTYTQVYPGEPRLGATGTLIPGASLVVNNTVPVNSVLAATNYDAVFTADGLWTMELLTATPFGIDRLAYVSFTINRTISIHATVSTIE